MFTVYLLIFDEVLPSSNTFKKLTIFRDFAAERPLHFIFSPTESSSGIVINKNMYTYEPKDKYKNVQSSTIHNIQLKHPSKEWKSYDMFIKWSSYTATKREELPLHAMADSHKQNVEGSHIQGVHTVRFFSYKVQSKQNSSMMVKGRTVVIFRENRL